jgi:8-oxo-dGTP pyrophosphatase MutT (NUDIX family)
MTADTIKTLLNHIPRYAEEEGDFYSVSREELIDVLCLKNEVSREVAENTIGLVENLLDTLAVLNSTYLQKGEWCFVSFPAQLLAMSILSALSEKESHLFSSNFWNTQDISSDKKDQQREVLRYIENQRVACHFSQHPALIRYIYVAWAIIKLDNQILLYQREDTQKRHDKAAGDYGLIGGRLNQHDIQQSFSGDMQACLKVLQSDNVEFIKESLPTTLKRELREEAGLIFETHYTFKAWRTLKPYSQVQGSAPNHAYTQYYFEIFYIELTLEGYLFLQQKVKSDERLVWFSIDEIINGQTVDGKISYLKALINNFENNSETLRQQLKDLSNSFNTNYLYQPKKQNDYALTLPANNQGKILFGFKGKEKPLDISLSENQLAILLGLATHNRDCKFNSIPANIFFHPYGWIEIKNDNLLQKELTQLSMLFKQTEFTIENQKDKFFRFSIEPSVIYFDDKFFSYSALANDLNSTKSKIPITLTRQPITTAFGMTELAQETFVISLKLANDLQNLSEQQHSSDNEKAQRIEDNYSKTLAKEPQFLALGLKNLVRRENGIMKFCVSLIPL